MGKNRDFSKFPNAITVLDNGNVGIGVTSPTTISHIASASNTTLTIENTSTAASNTRYSAIYLRGFNAVPYERSWQIMNYSADTTERLAFSFNNGSGVYEKVSVLGNGNVGIGTISPNIASFSGTCLTLESGGSTSTKSSGIELAWAGATRSLWGGYSGGVYIGTWTNENFEIRTNATERLRVTNAGQVGIGTSSPSAPLTIAYPVTGSAIAATNTQTSYDYARLRIKLYSESNVGLSIGYAGANYTYIQTSYNEGTSSPLLLNPFGNGVGIGTAPGSNMLSIGGNASSNFRVAIEDSTAGTSGVNKLVNITNQVDADIAINVTKSGATDKYAQITPSVSGLPIVIGVNNNPVKKPSNPAFSAYYTIGGNVSGANVKLTGYTSATTNIGNCYNTSTCRFTANVAGMYLFKGQAWLPPNSSLAALSIRVNGVQKAAHRMSSTGTLSNYCTLTPTLIWYLNVGDYIELYTSVDGGEIHLSTGETYSNFSGIFLG